MAQLEVYPAGASWRWVSRDDDGEVLKDSQDFDSRREAFEDALVERDSERIVLLREDRSVHGELYHESREGGAPQHVDILAATSRDEAVNVNG